MYTIRNAAQILGIAQPTLGKWITQAGIQKVTLTTDRTRVYIKQKDMLTLIAKHRHDLYKLTKLPKKPLNSQEEELYTLKEVANILDVSKGTIKTWLSRSDIQTKTILTDHKRIYITYTDMLTLAYKNQHKIAIPQKALEGLVIDQEGNCYQIQPGEKQLYTLKETAQLLNVSVDTISRWLRQSNVNKKVIVTDRPRVYLLHSDIVQLAEHYQQKPQEDGFYTLEEVAVLLRVAVSTVRVWVEKFNVSKKIVITDKRRVYVEYSALMMHCGPVVGTGEGECSGVVTGDRKGRVGAKPHVYTLDQTDGADV